MVSKRGATRAMKKERVRTPVPWAAIRGWLGRILVLAIGLACAVGASAYSRQHEMLPIHHVKVVGEFVYADKAALIEAIRPHASGGLMSVDVKSVSEAGEALPWVARVETKRIWPDTVSLHVYEQKVLARWGDKQVINITGEVFTPIKKALPIDLVILDGPEEVRQLISQQVSALSASFAEVGLTLQRLEMNKRRASEMTFSNGLKLIVGQGHTVQRIQRFKRVYRKVLQHYATEITVVDMRYSNGMAVAWKNGQKPNLHGAV